MRVVPFAVKSIGDTPGVFEGYGSVFGVIDSYRDVVAPGAFTRTLREDRKPALLWQHDASCPIGVWLELKEDETGLYVKGQLAETDDGTDAYKLLKMGALSGLSIGFSTVASSTDETTGVRTLLDVKLWEVSLVTFPANDPARVSAVKADGTLPTEREFERWLQREAGFSNSQAQTIIAKGYRQALRGGSAAIDDVSGESLLALIAQRGALATPSRES